jgi:hypothetical protein
MEILEFTMREMAAIYWIIGCFIVGGAMVKDRKECPNDPPLLADPVRIVAAVAVWPALAYAGSHLAATGCKKGTP